MSIAGPPQGAQHRSAQREGIPAILDYVVTVEFAVQPEQAAAFERLLMDNARTSLQVEPGCRVFDVCTAPQVLGRFFLYEVYDDAQAFQAHLASAHFKAFDAAVQPWVLQKTVRCFERRDSTSE